MDPMTMYAIASAVASIGGGIAGSSAKRKAEDEQRRQSLSDRALIKDASEQAASATEASAGPLFAQAVGLERASRFRDPMVEQGLLSGLRQQAGAQAEQGRQLGQGDRRGAVVGQLLRGQGLLAAESQRLQRFTQMSQMAAQLRSQGAQIMGQASQARLQGAVGMAGINVPVSGFSGTAVALGGLSSGLAAMGSAAGKAPEAPAGTPEGLVTAADLEGLTEPGGVAAISAPDLEPEAYDFDTPGKPGSLTVEGEFEPLAPMGLEGMDGYRAPAGFGNAPPIRRSSQPFTPHLRLDASRGPIGREKFEFNPGSQPQIAPQLGSTTDSRLGTTSFGKMWDPITQTYRR